MGAHRAAARKRGLPLFGALFFVLFLLGILFSVLQPSPSLAQSQDDEVWFTVKITDLDQLTEKGIEVDLEDLIKETEIVVYMGGKARAEESKETTAEGSSGDSTETEKRSHVFKGRYDRKAKPFPEALRAPIRLPIDMLTGQKITAIAGKAPSRCNL